MGVIKLSASQLTAKKDELSALNANLKTQIRDLSAQIKSLDAEWEGNAADAFQAAASKDIMRMENVASVVDTYTKSLDVIISEYKKAEAMNVSIAKGN